MKCRKHQERSSPVRIIACVGHASQQTAWHRSTNGLFSLESLVKYVLRKYWEYCPPGISHFTLQLIWSRGKYVYLQRKSMTIQLRKRLVVIAEDSVAGLLGARSGWLSHAEPSGQRQACVWCCGEMMAKTNHSGDPTGDNWPGWSSCMKADVVKGKGEEAAVKTQGSRDLN